MHIGTHSVNSQEVVEVGGGVQLLGMCGALHIAGIVSAAAVWLSLLPSRCNGQARATEPA